GLRPSCRADAMRSDRKRDAGWSHGKVGADQIVVVRQREVDVEKLDEKPQAARKIGERNHALFFRIPDRDTKSVLLEELMPACNQLRSFVRVVNRQNIDVLAET